ncbi:MAG: bifunctional glutathionylspermidine amidase/synthase [Gammaproteobacteria bacterium]|nr:bifunctional glutathionylspermidine amidase/synthase [Gammaproteobacteria bacterium]
MSASNDPSHLPFGTVLGYAPGGVPAYSSDYETVDRREMPDRHAFRHYVNGVYTGYKWQCVEFARRWLLLNKGYVFEDIAMAYDIFRLPSVKCVPEGKALPLRAFRNGSQRRPEPGCMLIWDEGGEFDMTGHVAIVTDVHDDSIRVAEQNVDHRAWPADADYARELRASVSEDGGYWIRCSFGDATVLGWVIQTDDERHAERFEPRDPRLFDPQIRSVVDNGQHQKAWLNVANPDEAAYVEMMHGHRLSGADGDQYRYIRISESAQAELKRATNELHALFMHATDHVLQDDKLLARFNIPRILWPRIHQSWDNRRNQMITGRFDFCLNEDGIKLYEYNADSASCYMECGKVQGKWARHFGCEEGRDPGERLHQQLVEAWREAEVEGLVHIMHDRDLEESYHALFMKEAMTEAGLECRVIKGLQGLSWDDAGNVLDPEGRPIRWVWKTWAWETALDQLRAEADDEGQRAALKGARTAAPRLMDVLLRPETMIFEPLWTLIPSNKAILPILWQLFPDHPYLLDSQFELTDALRKHGHVTKPIAGRCGDNVALFDRTDSLIVETEGRFGGQEQIYQRFWPLPTIEGYRVQLCTFWVGGSYGGACVRVDPSLIITNESNLLALRVLEDRLYLKP